MPGRYRGAGTRSPPGHPASPALDPGHRRPGRREDRVPRAESALPLADGHLPEAAAHPRDQLQARRGAQPRGARRAAGWSRVRPAARFADLRRLHQGHARPFSTRAAGRVATGPGLPNRFSETKRLRRVSPRAECTVSRSGLVRALDRDDAAAGHRCRSQCRARPSLVVPTAEGGGRRSALLRDDQPPRPAPARSETADPPGSAPHLPLRAARRVPGHHRAAVRAPLRDVSRHAIQAHRRRRRSAADHGLGGGDAGRLRSLRIGVRSGAHRALLELAGTQRARADPGARRQRGARPIPTTGRACRTYRGGRGRRHSGLSR